MIGAKTRIKIVDEARELFAKKGVDNTTINDIALASGISRRTVYTYFKSKDDVYQAVIAGELETLTRKMSDVVNTDLSPELKMMEMIFTRLEAIKEVVLRNGSLRADFFRDIFTVEKVRKSFDRKEIELFRTVLKQGVDAGLFSVDDIYLTAQITHFCLKGLEIPYIRGNLAMGMSDESRRRAVLNIVTGALHYKK